VADAERPAVGLHGVVLNARAVSSIMYVTSYTARPMDALYIGLDRAASAASILGASALTIHTLDAPARDSCIYKRVPVDMSARPSRTCSHWHFTFVASIVDASALHLSANDNHTRARLEDWLVLDGRAPRSAQLLPLRTARRRALPETNGNHSHACTSLDSGPTGGSANIAGAMMEGYVHS
jgi:hypothetical protein